ncbi:MAG TPA: hypothetical protein VEM35_08630 [Rhizomicrobium sp.]|nr:hypothetical protein [Rhizomicrobium sp.]
MRPDFINRVSATLPVILSLLACGLVLGAVATGWGMARNDEGAAAHLFQLLIAAQIPIIVIYILTADWRRWRTPVGRLALQVAALMLAFAPVAYFRL